jgi:hypothetical protein
MHLGGIDIGEVQRVLSRHSGNSTSEEVRGGKVDSAGSTSKRDVARVGAAQLDRSTCADGHIVRTRLERFIISILAAKGRRTDDLARVVDGGGLVIQAQWFVQRYIIAAAIHERKKSSRLPIAPSDLAEIVDGLGESTDCPQRVIESRVAGAIVHKAMYRRVAVIGIEDTHHLTGIIDAISIGRGAARRAVQGSVGTPVVGERVGQTSRIIVIADDLSAGIYSGEIGLADPRWVV